MSISLFSGKRKARLAEEVAEKAKRPREEEEEEEEQVPSKSSGPEEREEEEEEERKEAETFGEMGLSNWIQKTCQEMGYLRPTPVQKACIPQVLLGKNVVGNAETGSGKTAAFALPILQKLSEDPFGIFALILTPTRELAHQISEQLTVFGSKIGLRHTLVIGGLGLQDQARKLARKPHVVIATPGRLVDHLQNCPTFNLDRIKFFVMDEADRLLTEQGRFVEQICSHLPPLSQRQTLFFSATMTPSHRSLIEQMVSEMPPFIYQQNSDQFTITAKLDQKYMLVPEDLKECYLVEYISKTRPSSTIVFVSTCRGAALLGRMMKELRIAVVELHGLLSQRERITNLQSFRSEEAKILIATDIAGRGLDIPSVKYVINFDVPFSAEEYVHRVGRTARAGRAGTAITFVTPNDLDLMQHIESTLNKEIEEMQMDEESVMLRVPRVLKAKHIGQVGVDEDSSGNHRGIKRRQVQEREQVRLLSEATHYSEPPRKKHRT